jgi:hypothetical protein
MTAQWRLRGPKRRLTWSELPKLSVRKKPGRRLNRRLDERRSN